MTSGIWLSKPFIGKQSNGKDIAIILMDTQGVFDSGVADRDSMTIFWISLLLSSCLVLNLFKTSEDFLSRLETFLNYGLLANKSDTGADAEFPFQNLVSF